MQSPVEVLLLPANCLLACASGIVKVKVILGALVFAVVFNKFKLSGVALKTQLRTLADLACDAAKLAVSLVRVQIGCFRARTGSLQC